MLGKNIGKNPVRLCIVQEGMFQRLILRFIRCLNLVELSQMGQSLGKAQLFVLYV